MEEKIVKLGVVGLGRGFDILKDTMGAKHAQIRAICDKNPILLKKAKDFFEGEGVQDLLCFDDFDDILKSDIDAIVIATEAVCHVPFVIKALDAGKHVLSEIPTVNSIDEARQLKAAVKAHPELKYMTGENGCYWAFIQMWKKMYDDGRFGDVVYAEAEYIHARDFRDFTPDMYPDNHWRKFIPAIRYITHSLGPLLYIMSDRCKTITCLEPDIKYNPYKEGAGNGIALIKTETGAVIRIYVGFGAYMSFNHSFRLNGTRGSIETDRLKYVNEAHSYANLSDIPGTLHKKIDIPVTASFPGENAAGQGGAHGGTDGKMMRDFIRCIVEDTPPTLDVDMGIAMSVPGILAHESAINGGIPMEMPEI